MARSSSFSAGSFFSSQPLSKDNTLPDFNLYPSLDQLAPPLGVPTSDSFDAIDHFVSDPLEKIKVNQILNSAPLRPYTRSTDSQRSSIWSPSLLPQDLGSDIEKIKDDEVQSIRDQWQSFLAEYQRIYDEANDSQKANWQAAADWNERMYRDQWKMQVEGLREAGINPLMMAGALRASSVPQMSAASVVAPSFPSNEFSATADTEIAGLYSLYATLQTLDSEERRAELARILGYAELSQKAADSILRFIGSFIPSTSIIKRG